MTSLSQKSINNSLTRANSSEIAGYAMPTQKYEEVSLQASGTEYEAPADGYFAIRKESGAGGQYLAITCGYGFQIWSNGIGYYSCFIPVKKGNKVKVTYTMNSTVGYFRFYYLGGNESEAQS